ncbi:hypothetical protein GLW04_04890 [Halobacillus litoralis]|uniref:Swarming motility protein SwrB n=1 Tax=Halobacillus litoralis TaxID=45668 RepID=A0A845DP79_9BACI|nr:hypothetical protein [Halobacillus litoralis]MYL19216.1 hypothetical protein [Halobacillus litoralis]
MTSFLLVVSFLVDGLILFGLMIMMKKIRRTEELERRQEQVASEIEDLFSSYLYEIKEENKRMEAWASSSSVTEQVSAEGGDEEKHSMYVPPVPDPSVDDYQPSLHSKVMEMKKNGWSAEEAARALNKGKTEIELMYKFNR